MLSFLKTTSIDSIYVDGLDSRIGTIELIDVRESYEFKKGSIKTAKNIPMGELLNSPEKYLSKDKKYYIMCQSGGRSCKVTEALANQGYNVVNVVGGMGAYSGKYRV